jgi:hypothetical protein
MKTLFPIAAIILLLPEPKFIKSPVAKTIEQLFPIIPTLVVDLLKIPIELQAPLHITALRPIRTPHELAAISKSGPITTDSHEVLPILDWSPITTDLGEVPAVAPTPSEIKVVVLTTLIAPPPEIPEEPEVPAAPSCPEVPEDPLTPEVPDDPDIPEVPEDPEEPEIPEVPEEPDWPDVPEEPLAPEVPDEPF